MKTHTVVIAVMLTTTNAFVVRGPAVASTSLDAEVNSVWAFDVYGRDDGELPSLEIPYTDDDAWFYHPWSGIGQSDFIAKGHQPNQLFGSPTEEPAIVAAAPPPPSVAETPVAPPLPQAQEAEAMPDPSMAAMDQAMAQVSS